MFSHKIRRIQKHQNLFKNIYLYRFYSKGATPEGTLRYTQKFPLYSQKAIGFSHTRLNNGWMISPVGYGAMKITYKSKDNQASLQYAVQAGCNVIDTGLNYEDGSSEAMIGLVVNGMIEEEIIKRDEIVIMSKIGNIQKSLIKDAEQKQFPDITKDLHPYYQHWHCIAPEFLEYGITKSLKRLNTGQIDVLFLETPELSWNKEDKDGKEFYEKLRRAFVHLEKEVENGRIQKYGIMSNNFTNVNEPRFISIDKCLEIAKNIKENHNFQFIQFPFNIHESEAFTKKLFNGKNLIEYAKERGLHCTTCRPLTAYLEKDEYKCYKFIDIHEEGGIVDNFKAASQLLEDTIKTELNVPWQWPKEGEQVKNDEILPHRSGLAWAQIVFSNLSQFNNIQMFKRIREERIEPEIEFCLTILQEHKDRRRFNDWVIKYNYLINKAFGAFEKFLNAKHVQEVELVTEKILECSPSLADSQSLSQKAIRVLASSGVDCVLVGMRHYNYVRDVLFELGSRIPDDEVAKVLEKVEWVPLEMKGDKETKGKE